MSDEGNTPIDRIFLVMHPGEIGMGVDTSKLILASHPMKCRFVVAGIGSKYQSSMAELEMVMAQNNCLVLFPDEASRPFHEIAKEREGKGEAIITKRQSTKNKSATTPAKKYEWNIVVIDGTWQQARRIKKRYFETEEFSVRTTRLSDKVVSMLGQEMVGGELNPGHQLRKHSSTSRKVGTFEAARLFLGDLADYYQHTMENHDDDEIKLDNSGNSPLPSWIQMEKYQQIANSALQAQKDCPC